MLNADRQAQQRLGNARGAFNSEAMLHEAFDAAERGGTFEQLQFAHHIEGALFIALHCKGQKRAEPVVHL